MGITGIAGVLAGCLGGDDDPAEDDAANGDDEPANGNGADNPWDDYEAPDDAPERATPGAEGLSAEPPENATILWDGDEVTLDDWEHSGVGPLGHEEDGADAEWLERNEFFEIEPGTGDLRPAREGIGSDIGDCHLHLEWRVPEEIDGESPVVGNSGVFMMERYEIQVLNSYDIDDNPGGEAGTYYATDPTLAMPIRPPGEWNEFDILWRGPRFDEDNELTRYPQVTVFFNGVCVKNHFDVPGPNWAGIWDFDDDQHGHMQTDGEPLDDGEPATEWPFYLQDHHDELDVAHFRNIWYYDLPEEPVEIDDPDEMPQYDTASGEADEFPEHVDPGDVGTTGEPPADADVFVDDLTLAPGEGDFESDQEYGDCQIHLEWRVPADAEAEGPWRGNSGLRIGDYEIQILDTYDNPIEAEEWAGAYTGGESPHYDAVRESGEWQALDVVFQGPRFEDGEVRPAQVTALLNGVAVQSRLQIEGPNPDGELGDYEEHDEELAVRLAEPIEDGSEVDFRNGWIRSLA